jgi:hypothetical protein
MVSRIIAFRTSCWGALVAMYCLMNPDMNRHWSIAAWRCIPFSRTRCSRSSGWRSSRASWISMRTQESQTSYVIFVRRTPSWCNLTYWVHWEKLITRCSRDTIFFSYRFQSSVQVSLASTKYWRGRRCEQGNPSSSSHILQSSMNAVRLFDDRVWCGTFIGWRVWLPSHVPSLWIFLNRDTRKPLTPRRALISQSE